MVEQAQSASEAHGHHAPAGKDSKDVLHRVCIQCNHMFRVTPQNFDAKQCPDCHKG